MSKMSSLRSRSRRSPSGLAGAAALAVMVALATHAPDAGAQKVVDRVLAGGSGVAGTLQGQFGPNGPRGIAANDSSIADGSTDPLGASTNGYIYVVDADNQRIQVFGADGSFKFMFGRGVVNGGDGHQICDSSEVPCTASTTADDEQGEFSVPQGIAIDQSTGHVYVRDRTNRRVQEFEADGDFVRAWGWDVVATGPGNDIVAPNNEFEICVAANGDVCKTGTTGANGGQFATNTNVATGIAVDPAAPHNVYVADPQSRRVQEFTSTGAFVRLWGWDVASSTAGVENLGTNSFEICSSTVAARCKAGANSTPADQAGAFATTFPRDLAIDGASGVLFASDSAGSNRVQRFDTDEATPADLLDPALDITTLSGGSSVLTNGLDVHAGTGNLLVSKSVTLGVLEVSSPAAAASLAGSHFANATTQQPQAIATDPAPDLLYVGVGGERRVYLLDDDGAPPAVVTLLPATSVGATSASVSAEVDSSGTLATSYRVEVSRNGVTWTNAASGTVAAGATEVVSASVADLRPNTVYRYRVVTNKGYGNADVASAELTFLTDAVAPEIADANADSINDTSARLTARVNPHSTATTYRFEYGIGNFNHTVPLPDAAIGAGPDFVFVAQQLSGLQPGATFQYRVVATSVTEGATTSPTETFTTLALPPGLGGRAYELVTASEKFGGQGVGFWPGGLGHLTSSGVAAYRGERFAAQSQFGAVLEGDNGFSFSNDWAFVDRIGDQEGWRSHPPLTHPSYASKVAQPIAFTAATDDLSAIHWTSTSPLSFFPELVGGGDPANDRASWENVEGSMISDWGAPTRWELFGPTGLEHVANLSTLSTKRLINVTFSGDGSTAVGQTERSQNNGLPEVYGLAGANDPTWPSPANPATPGVPAYGDLISGRVLYIGDLSNGLADSFGGTGPRALANVCTEDDELARTEVPDVVGGDLAVQDCPAGIGGRAALISSRGAAFTASNVMRKGSVSRDGSRTFFLAPDPLATGVPNGTTQSCSGSGVSTLCPPQLYLRQRNGDGGVVTRWISRSQVAGQDASLTGAVRFEGASADGQTVYFRTNSPLTEDDPNGTGAPVPSGVTTGAPSSQSWDLYAFTLAPGDDPTGPGSSLTRISAGPDGAGDCNSPRPSLASNLDIDVAGALRFLSDDGTRAYFTCQAPLPGVGPSAENGSTLPGGTAATADKTNLYLYDANQPVAERWRFVARIPRAVDEPTDQVGNPFDVCASTGVQRRAPFEGGTQINSQVLRSSRNANCVSGSADGRFVTFFTTGALTADDHSDLAADVFGYDADSNELMRLSAPQGGNGSSYPCVVDTPVTPADDSLIAACRGDGGVDNQNGVLPRAPFPAKLGVATEPLTAGDRVAFFQSKSRLVADDLDDGYDVYRWRNGELSLVTSGAAGSDDALFKGNDVTGRNVYFVTREALTWQDTDVVADIYTARVGGGVPQPPQPEVCDVLADACQPAGTDSPPVAIETSPPADPANGDETPGSRGKVVLDSLTAAQKALLARGGRATIRVEVNRPGRVSLTGRARVGKRSRKVLSVSRMAGGAGSIRLTARLSRDARRQLTRTGRLRIALSAVFSEALEPATRSVTLRRAERRATSSRGEARR